MDFMIHEVDGSLANPVIAGGVIVWTAALSGVAILLGRQLSRSGWGWIRWMLVFAVALLVTRQAQLSIAQVLYMILSPGVTDVGFWGGPPVWIAPVVSCGIGILACAVFIRRRRTTKLGTLRSSQ